MAFSTILATGCLKTDDFDSEAQQAKDEELIKDFAIKNSLTLTRDDTGVYYQIITPGTGNITYSANTKITVRYQGRLLNGTVFDKTNTDPATFNALGGLIPGWQVAIPKIQPGGKVRALIPSRYGYGRAGNGPIPANSVLDFEIELISAQ